jgi:hypothetical protein
MAAEGQNVMQLSVYNAPVAAELMLQAMQRGELAGDARLLALTLAQFYAAQSTEQPKRCFTCGDLLDCPTAFVAITPRVDEPSTAVGSVICPACSGPEQAIRDRAFAVWREQVDPNARMISVSTTEGHA